ncbi:ABC transporter permease [Streptococcus massiliensis]|uniref:Oligopeptide transport system permease n=1 Tax=Streptococcus massiliensis TaxID=313439 RepID=A0A380L1T7_9STRE|nr:ABC transporter permease [Streptococcus massiliensis]SUN76560.1 oligopeptide transport system permease [Streptococcus massiliensis]
MKKYIFMRILRSLVSIFLVTTLIYTIVYTMVPRRLIFKQDPNYNKIAKTPDSKDNYENTIYERMGYIDYYDSKELQEKASKENSSVTVEGNATNKKIYEDYIKKIGNGWKLYQFKESKQFYAVRQVPVYERVFGFYANLIQVDHPWVIKDSSNKNLKRSISIENDPSVGWSLVGSGTRHKYLIYFNGSFPFIHQNIITLNLGTSYPTYANIPVLQVITQGQGQTKTQEVQFPKGKKMSSVNIYSRTYKSPSKADARDIANYGEGDAYTATENNYQYPSMIVNSSIIGLIGVIISYALALPLGAYMARFKNTWFDTGTTAFLTFLLSLPTIALVYVVRLVGSSIGFPDSFPILGAGDWRSYVLPSFILGILSVPGLAIWVRRYMIDQQSSDYVRFARAKGLSEKEISAKHIMKNAMVPIVQGIPAAILSVIVGATLTESVFAFPGMGKMLIDSAKAANNSMVVGLTFIFTGLSIIALLTGDILMTILDPRIKLSSKGGK